METDFKALEHFHRQQENDDQCMYTQLVCTLDEVYPILNGKKRSRIFYSFIHSYIPNIHTYIHTFTQSFCNCTHHVCHLLILTSGSPALFKCFFIHLSHPSTPPGLDCKPSSSSLELLILLKVPSHLQLAPQRWIALQEEDKKESKLHCTGCCCCTRPTTTGHGHDAAGSDFHDSFLFLTV